MGLGLVIVAALAATALGTTSRTVGDSSTEGVQCGVPDTIVETGTSAYTVPSGTWKATSWSTQGGGGTNPVTLLIYKDLGGGTYQVVAKSASEVSVAFTHNTYPLSLTVHGGELLGLFADLDAGCANAIGARPGATFNYRTGGSVPPVGNLVTPTTGTIANTGIDVAMQLTLIGENTGNHEGYCSTTGNFLNLDEGQGETDPTYAGSVPALYGQDYGITCDNLTARGYHDSGSKVDPTGTHTGTDADLYEYYAK